MTNNIILISGACGLLGSNFAHWIVKNHPNDKLILVDDLSIGYIENIQTLLLNSNVKFYQCDVADPIKMEEIFKTHKITHVAHYSAWAAELMSNFMRRYNYQSNIMASANIINLSIKYDIKKFLFTSSASVYGHGYPKGKLPFHEDDILVPNDVYAASKVLVETDLRIAHEIHNLPYIIIVPHNIFGKYQITDNYRNVITRFLSRVREELPMLIYGTGDNSRAFTCVDDILPCLYKALIDYNIVNTRINLGGIERTTINELANIVKNVVGYGEIKYMEPRHEVPHTFTTWERSVDLLGFEHKTSLEDGIKKVWEWIQSETIRIPKRFEENEIEVTKGLYEFWKPEYLRKERIKYRVFPIEIKDEKNKI